jgi:hypothetical protein
MVKQLSVPLREQDNLVEVYNLTRPLDGAVRTWGNEATYLRQDGQTADRLQTVSSLEISLSTTTHMDLPGAMSEWLGDPTWSEINEESWSVRSFDCLLVDVSKYAQIVRNALQNAGVKKLPEQVEPWWNSTDTIAEIINHLRITRRDVEWMRGFPGYFFAFYTGWRQFAPKDGDLSNPRWYPWHPYFLHPYLDYGAIHFLLLDKEGPLSPGIGCDIYGVETPIRFLHVAKQRELWDQTKYGSSDIEALRQKRDLIPSSLDGNRGYWPLHITALENHRLLIEQLQMPIDVFVSPETIDIGQGFRYRKGRLVISRLRNSNSKGHELVSAFFRC